jgi:hypothetical protein
MTKLWVVGLGLMCPSHVTKRCWQALEQADQLFFISDNLEKQAWLRQLNPNFRDLMVHYGPNKSRTQTYQDMADDVVGCLRGGQSAALVSYGHPLVFCDPSRLAIEQTMAAGFPVEILPGISSMDCLLADLRVDSENYGLQIYEASDLLIHGVDVSSNCSQIIFQVPSLGDSTGGWKPGRYRGFIRVLAECLAEKFGTDHEVVLYRGANVPGQLHHIDIVPLARLHEAPMIAEYTLWVPPVGYERLAPASGEHDAVALELVGYGPKWHDVSQEVEELLTGAVNVFAADTPPDRLQAAPLPPGEELWQRCSSERPATIVFPGHPCASGAIRWAREATRRGVAFRVRPAVSIEDQVYCDVPLDPGIGGFQSFLPGPLPVKHLRLATLARTPSDAESLPDAVAWSEPPAVFVPVAQPREIHNEPLMRALKLSAVERAVAFLESQSPEFVAALRSAPTPRMWLKMNGALATQRLNQALESTDLSQLNNGNWPLYLLQHPEHPQAANLLLEIRCGEAFEAIGSGISDAPLKEWLAGI